MLLDLMALGSFDFFLENARGERRRSGFRGDEVVVIDQHDEGAWG